MSFIKGEFVELAITLSIAVVLIVLNVPIWASLVIAAAPYLLLKDIPFTAISMYMCTGTMTSFILLAFPLFVFAGNLMNHAGITTKIFGFAETLVGWVRGGLGHVNVVASMIFAGMSGSAVADLGALGPIEIKGMTDRGYDIDFTAGVTLASSTIGPIIPPSTSVILYAVIANASVAKLFLGGFLPGILMGLSLMIMIFFYCKNKNYPVREKPSVREIATSFKDVFLALLNPVIIVLGMVGGVFTPTEASAIAVLYAAFLGVVVYRSLTFEKIVTVLSDSVKLVSNVYLVLGPALLFSFILTRENVGNYLIHLIASLNLHATSVLFMLTGLILIMGCFVEVTAMMILMLPIIMPVIKSIGVDITHFGLLFIMTAVMGILTPPFGLGLFIISGMTGLSVPRLSRAVFPFLIPLIITIMLVLLMPDIVLFLPNLLMD
jgi:tripartite ATP-independent transporter DctM subunit